MVTFAISSFLTLLIMVQVIMYRRFEPSIQGHYNYYGIIGNSQAIDRFYFWSLRCTFKWLNRRDGQRKSYDKEHFKVKACRNCSSLNQAEEIL